MMRRLRTHVARALVALCAVVWVVAGTENQVHDLRTTHVVCAEHGELVELDATAHDGPRAHVAEARAVSPHDQHGCSAFDAVPTPPAAQLGPQRLSRAALPSQLARTTPAAPRGPPLAYAPKTSPPLS